MLRQPNTQPVTQQQLVVETNGIYEAVVCYKSKCVKVDGAWSSKKESASKELSDEQWQALSDLHQALLYKYYNFFLASQHPNASAPLKRTASKNSMPTHIWHYRIHSYLKVLYP